MDIYRVFILVILTVNSPVLSATTKCYDEAVARTRNRKMLNCVNRYRKLHRIHPLEYSPLAFSLALRAAINKPFTLQTAYFSITKSYPTIEEEDMCNFIYSESKTYDYDRRPVTDKQTAFALIMSMDLQKIGLAYCKVGSSFKYVLIVYNDFLTFIDPLMTVFPPADSKGYFNDSDYREAYTIDELFPIILPSLSKASLGCPLPLASFLFAIGKRLFDKCS